MATAKILLYKSKTLKDGTHPVMMQLINDRKIKRISLKRSCSCDQWDETSSRFKKTFPDYVEQNRYLTKIEAKMNQTMDWFEYEGIQYTEEKFLQKIGKTGKTKTVNSAFDEVINRLEKEGKLGNMKVYRDTRNSLIRFIGDRTIAFPDVDYSFLKKYESFLRVQECADSGIHLRMRTLRALYNEVIKQGNVPAELYPFSTHGGKKGYSLGHLKLEYNPRALTVDELRRLKEFDPTEYPALNLSYQMFMFSYYAQGMNFVDLVNLKWSDIHDNRIKYKRQKTKRFIDLAISENIQGVLNKLESNGSEYIFPILISGRYKTAQSVNNRVKKWIKIFNKSLKEIQTILSIETQMTSYTSRHTYAMSLKRNGSEDHVISHNLGHANQVATQHYLASLENNVYDSANSVL